MSQDIFESSSEKLLVTSYCGPANTVERTRMRLQISVTAPEGYASLGYNEVKSLQTTLDRWLTENDRAPRKEHG